MSDNVGAIPLELIAWPSSVQGQTAPLNGAANRLNTAIEALNSAPKTAGLMGAVPYAGNSILGYVTRNGVIDAWVAKVGDAFARADAGSLPAGGSLTAELGALLKSLDTRATSTNSDIAAQAGANPLAAAEQAAAGTEAGAQLKEGVDTKNQSLVNGALTQLGQHQGQGPFDVHFFVTVGPKGTLAAVPMVKRAPNGLQTFDNGLAKATTSPGWDHAFNAALFKYGSDGAPDRNSLDLLAHGEYSTDFLTRAGDSWLFGAAAIGDRSFAAVPIFNALSQNPAAASAWFSGQAPGFGYRDSRIGALLGSNTNLALWQESILNQPAEQNAFNAALTAAGKAHDTGQLWTIVHAIYPPGGQPSNAAMPFWLGTAHIIAENIQLFVPTHDVGTAAPVSPKWTYNGRLFDFAETSLSSSVHPQAVQAIGQAVRNWITNAPVGTNWDHFANVAGQLWAMQALPQRQAIIDAFNNYQNEKAGVSQLVGMVPLPPIPGAHWVVNWAADTVVLQVGGKVAPGLVSGPVTSENMVDLKTNSLYYLHLKSLQTTLAQRWLEVHPSQIPQGTDPSRYIAEVGANPGILPQPGSLHDILGSGGSGLSQVYDRTGRTDPQGG